MINNIKYGLPHLNNLPKDVYTFQISPYVVALEGWRRGLELTFINTSRAHSAPSNAISYKLSDGVNEYIFTCARSSAVSKEAISICRSKTKTYELLKKNSIPTPEGELFTINDNIENILDYSIQLGFPVVVKATDLGGGKGVYTALRTEKDIKQAVNEIFTVHKKNELIIEKFIEGFDYRIYVVGNKVSAVTKYLPLNVLGDGVNSIKALIKISNNNFKKNVAFRTRNIVVDDEMLKYLIINGYTLDYIPRKGERIFLREQGKYLFSRLPIDCTDSTSELIKDIAIKAVNSIDGLKHASVDLIVNETKGEAYVNEINSRGEISMHMFPFEGKPQDVAKDIINYYFPNTIERENKFYFEYKPIKEAFVSGYADEIKIPMIPTGVFKGCEYLIKGSFLGPVYLNWLKKRAARLGLIGIINRIELNKIRMFFYGTEKNLKKIGDIILKEGTEKSKISQIYAKDMDEISESISISIEIIDELVKKNNI